MPQHWTLLLFCAASKVGIRVVIVMQGPILRSVKTRRIGSRSNLETDACPLLRALPALSYEPAIRRAKPFVSVRKVIHRAH